MNKSGENASAQVTRWLVGLIIISSLALATLVYMQLIFPKLQANKSLDNEICIADNKLCFKHLSSWTVGVDQTSLGRSLMLYDSWGNQQLAITYGGLEPFEDCDHRERRALYIISSQPTQLKDNSQDTVYLATAVIETVADGFFVPAIYLTSHEAHSDSGQIQGCELESANVIALTDSINLHTGIDGYQVPLGSSAPVYRSVGEAEAWLSSVDAKLTQRTLASLRYR